MNQINSPQHKVKLAASLTGLYIQKKESAEPVNRWRRPWKTSLYLEQMLKNSPAYGAWNVKKALMGTGEIRLSISIKALRRYLKAPDKGDTYK